MGGKMVNGDTCKRNDRYQTSDTSTAKKQEGEITGGDTNRTIRN